MPPVLFGHFDLLDAGSFRDLVSGRRQGPVAAALRGLLRLGEFPYTWVVRRRNRSFDSGQHAAVPVGVPVVSVGNLTLGGTGKTPMVAWLARWFCNRGVRTALVSRGYKSGTESSNDEARELEQRLPGVPHLQNPDRVAAARAAIEEFKCELILLDDGFQHRRIARDLDIVLIDALEPLGFGHVFPRGTLREPLEGLKRADVVVLTRADMVDELERTRIHGIVEQIAPSTAWAECRHSPQRLLTTGGNEEFLGTLFGKSVAAFCGIGNPAGFRHTLEQCGIKVTAWREFPDHHAYNQNDIEELTRWAAAQNVAAIVCTQKDLVKLTMNDLADKPLWAINIGLEFLTGQNEVEASLQALLSKGESNA